jgi:hypothetical protein
MRGSCRRSIGAASLVLLACTGAPARAQIIFESVPPPITLDIATSIRSAAMAGAGAAVLWGEPDVWANPATLAGLRGVSWVQGHTNLNPSFSNHIVFDSQQLLIGGAGIGMSLMGQPFAGLGKARFDSGPITLGGTPVDPLTFSLFEETRSFGLAISPLRLLDALRAEHDPDRVRLTDVGELAVGYQTERTHGGLEPSLLGGTFEEGESDDWGVSGRLALGRMWWPAAPFRLDLAAAYSDLNQVLESGGSFAGTPTRFRRGAVALHAAARPPAERASPPASPPWWRPAEAPGFTATLAYDHDLRTEIAFDREDEVDHVGLEAELLQLLALRVGYVSDRERDIHAVAYGGGVTLPVGPWGRAGYQYASEPLAEGLKPRVRQGFFVWVDPARIWSDTQRR